ncbi:MAG: EAL domain-containing protein [Acidimicrobiales bacterium]
MRWRSPSFGDVPPSRFIPLAERTGLLARLTDRILGEALDSQLRWRTAGLDLPVAVNLSPATLTAPDLSRHGSSGVSRPAGCLQAASPSRSRRRRPSISCRR